MKNCLAAFDRSGADRLIRFFLLIAVVVGALLLSGCANTRGGTLPYGVQDFGVPDGPAPVMLDANYKIAPLDTLEIKVFKFEDLSGEYEVDLTGHVALPLIGNVKAVDLTPDQLKTELTQEFGEKYLQSPDVTVAVKSSTSRSVTVDGSVRQPGMYPINGPMTLIQAVALARGTDENANPRRTAIFRQIDGKRMAAAFDLTSIRRGEEPDPPVYSGDIVVVDGTQTKEVVRNVLATLPVLSLFRPY